MNYRKMLMTLTLGALTACQGPAGENGAEGPAGETGLQGEQGVAGNNGTNGQDLAAPAAAIASVAPNAMLVGRTTTVRIVGYFTEWDETTTVRLTDMEDVDVEGIEVSTVVVSAVGIVATVTVAADVALGAVKLHVITGDNALAYMPEGASVAVTATATSNQAEIRAGDEFDILIETAEYMSSPTLNGENCVGVQGVSLARYSQYKFRVTGLMHPATTLGDCAMRLIQDVDTDDEWSSAVVVTITAPDVITFAEGVASGEITPERPFRIVSLNAGANEVVSLRHTIDDANNLDGTGPEIDVFVEGNLEPIAVHPGTDRWLEVASLEARELLVTVRNLDLAEGDDPVAFSLTTLVPNTTMTALQDGATQAQRLPANEGGSNEAGRGSWYSIANESAAYATLTVSPVDETTLQPVFALIKDDANVGSGTTSWEGVMAAGTHVFGILDDQQAETDGVLSFNVQLNRSPILAVDENGAGSGTLQTDATDMYLIDTAENSVTSLTVTSEANVAITATWVGQEEPIRSGSGTVEVPAVAAGQLLFRLSAEGDLGEGAAYTVQVSSAEIAELDMTDGATGSAPEVGSAWYMAMIEPGAGAITTLTVTAGTADHLQPNIAMYTVDGEPIISGENEITALTLEPFFISVRDTDFVADQDQTFTISVSTNNNPIDVACYSTPNLDVGETERGEFRYIGNTALAGDAYNPPSAADQVLSITLENPATIDMYTNAGWDTMLYVYESCGQDWGTRLAYNDDGSPRDWDGAQGGPNRWTSAINSLQLPAGTSYIIVTAYSASQRGLYYLNYRLRNAQ